MGLLQQPFDLPFFDKLSILLYLWFRPEFQTWNLLDFTIHINLWLLLPSSILILFEKKILFWLVRRRGEDIDFGPYVSRWFGLHHVVEDLPPSTLSIKTLTNLPPWFSFLAELPWLSWFFLFYRLLNFLIHFFGWILLLYFNSQLPVYSSDSLFSHLVNAFLEVQIRQIISK